MFKLTIKPQEMFDSEKEEFINLEPRTVTLEHSLVSLSKWESKWEIPYLGEKEKTTEQTVDYIRCMCLDEDVDPQLFSSLSAENLEDLEKYITAKQTATWFTQTGTKKKGRSETITSELVYYWMIALQIPWESQHWHLNRLLTLIEVCNRKNEKPKKQNKQEQIARQRELNAKRRAEMESPG